VEFIAASCGYNKDMTSMRRLFLRLTVVVLLTRGVAVPAPPPDSEVINRQDLLGAVKRLERKLGFRRTKNFKRQSSENAVSYRCYYTGKLELPDSYETLKLLQGTKDGCPLDTKEYDVFFYPLEASGSGKTPLSASLANESMERFLVVVPHEDFHSSKELKKLPVGFGEASATLAGFLTAMEVAREKFGENSDVYLNLRREPELFAQKAEVVNRYHSQLRRLYAAAHEGQISESDALEQKRQAFEELHRACSAINPEPKSFNRCSGANNNAGLAFDETYTKYYPLMYKLYLAEGRQVKPTLSALERGLNANTEADALNNLEKAVPGPASEVRSQPNVK
jgi:hypothetical protein